MGSSFEYALLDKIGKTAHIRNIKEKAKKNYKKEKKIEASGGRVLPHMHTV